MEAVLGGQMEAALGTIGSTLDNGLNEAVLGSVGNPLPFCGS